MAGIEIPSSVLNDRQRIEQSAAAATAELARLTTAYRASTDDAAAAATLDQERLAAAIAGQPTETTINGDVSQADLVGAISDLLGRTDRPAVVASYLQTGRSGSGERRRDEIAAANLWHENLLRDPEQQRRLLAGDRDELAKLTLYSVYAPGPHE
jgi:hypothetical protein